MPAGMCECTRCHTEFPEFMGTAEPDIDGFGLRSACPVCGRRNRLRSLGEDEGEDGLLLFGAGR